MSRLKSKTFKSLSNSPQGAGASRSPAKRKKPEAIVAPAMPVIVSLQAADLHFKGTQSGMKAQFAAPVYVDFVNHWLKIDSISSNFRFKARVDNIARLRYYENDDASLLVVVFYFRAPVDFHSCVEQFPARCLGMSFRPHEGKSTAIISRELRACIGADCEYLPMAAAERIRTFPSLFYKEQPDFVSPERKVKASPSLRKTRSINSGITLVYQNEDTLDEKFEDLMCESQQHAQFEDIPEEDQVYFHPKLRVTFNDKSHFTISNDDFRCLYNGNWINDTIVDLFLHFGYQENNIIAKSQEPRNAAEPSSVTEAPLAGPNEVSPLVHTTRPKIEILNSFFYTSLSRSTPQGNYYKNVKSWFRNKNDLFLNDYVVIPIMQDLHWYVVILKNLKSLIEPPPEDKPDLCPAIYFLDSLKKRHSGCAKILKSFIKGYAHDKYPDVSVDKSSILDGDSSVPKQNNFNDCGVHVISNVNLFLKDPLKFDSLVLRKDSTNIERDHLFALEDRLLMRQALRHKLLDLLREQVSKSGNAEEIEKVGMTYSQLEKRGHKTEHLEVDTQGPDEDDDDVMIVNVVKKDSGIDTNNIIDLHSPRRRTHRRKLKDPKYSITLDTKPEAGDSSLNGKRHINRDSKFREALQKLKGSQSKQREPIITKSPSETPLKALQTTKHGLDILSSEEEDISEIKQDSNLLTNTPPLKYKETLKSSPIRLSDNTDLIKQTHGKRSTSTFPDLHSRIANDSHQTSDESFYDKNESTSQKHIVTSKKRSSDVTVARNPFTSEYKNIDTKHTDVIQNNVSGASKVPHVINIPVKVHLPTGGKTADFIGRKVVDPSVINGTRSNLSAKKTPTLGSKRTSGLQRSQMLTAQAVTVVEGGGVVSKMDSAEKLKEKLKLKRFGSLERLSPQKPATLSGAQNASVNSKNVTSHSSLDHKPYGVPVKIVENNFPRRGNTSAVISNGTPVKRDSAIIPASDFELQAAESTIKRLGPATEAKPIKVSGRRPKSNEPTEAPFVTRNNSKGNQARTTRSSIFDDFDTPIVLLSPPKFQQDPSSQSSIIKLDSPTKQEGEVVEILSPQASSSELQPLKTATYRKRDHREQAVKNQIPKSKMVPPSPPSASSQAALSDSSPIKLTDDAPAGATVSKSAVIKKKLPPPRRVLRSASPPDKQHQELPSRPRSKRSRTSVSPEGETKSQRVNSRNVLKTRKIRSQASERYRIHQVVDVDEEPSPDFEVI